MSGNPISAELLAQISADQTIADGVSSVIPSFEASDVPAVTPKAGAGTPALKTPGGDACKTCK